MDSDNLVNLLKKHLQAKQYDVILALMQDAAYKNEVQEHYSTIIDICREHLTDENFKANADLYYCCEDILTIVASCSPPDGVLYGLIETVEETKSDQIFTTALKALQIVLLRQRDQPRLLEWSLDSVFGYLNKLPYPNYLTIGYDEKEGKLIEQDDEVSVIRKFKVNFLLAGFG